MRNVNFCLVLVIVCLTACISEVKPILKPAELDVPARIANQLKWLDQGIASGEYTREAAKPIQERLYKIREKYNKMQASGALSARDSESLSRMLDETSEMIFRIGPARRKM